MADFKELQEKNDQSGSAYLKAQQEFIKVSGIKRLAVREVKEFGAAQTYVELLERLTAFLPEVIVFSNLNGFFRSDIVEKQQTNEQLHVHFDVNDQPHCITVDGHFRAFENAFLIQLNNILCGFSPAERFRFVFSSGLAHVDEMLEFAYVSPETYVAL